MNTIILAHYYTEPEVQNMADCVGDSLDLSKFAKEHEADRIVFAGVRFMAETAKLLNPNAQVILPDSGSTCSLVEMTDINRFRKFISDMTSEQGLDRSDFDVVTYINSSVQMKAESDIIVTSAIVEDVIDSIISKGRKVLFTPDRNMGAYLAFQHPEWEENFNYFTEAVCEVHEKFVGNDIRQLMKGWYDYPPVLLAHPEAPLPVLVESNYVGSTKGMLDYVKNYDGRGIIFVATEDGLLYNMRNARPDLDIRLAGSYKGCQCNSCPYMRKNTVELVQAAQEFGKGEIVEIDSELAKKALKSINRMIDGDW